MYRSTTNTHTLESGALHHGDVLLSPQPIDRACHQSPFFIFNQCTTKRRAALLKIRPRISTQRKERPAFASTGKCLMAGSQQALSFCMIFQTVQNFICIIRCWHYGTNNFSHYSLIICKKPTIWDRRS
jgi:hypothetical protein